MESELWDCIALDEWHFLKFFNKSVNAYMMDMKYLHLQCIIVYCNCRNFWIKACVNN